MQGTPLIHALGHQAWTITLHQILGHSVRLAPERSLEVTELYRW